MTTTYPCLAAHISAVSCRTPPVAWASAPCQQSRHFSSRQDNRMGDSGSRRRQSRHSVDTTLWAINRWGAIGGVILTKKKNVKVTSSWCGFISVECPPSPNMMGGYHEALAAHSRSMKPTALHYTRSFLRSPTERIPPFLSSVGVSLDGAHITADSTSRHLPMCAKHASLHVSVWANDGPGCVPGGIGVAERA